ncbi:MAG: L,D-transpeptidase family protein [Actinomycetota bacterium]|nr:L,D-transpeptidase family protein [Actinomycetota bacterium]
MRSVAVRKAGTPRTGARKVLAVLALGLSACSSANAGSGATRAVGAADPSTTLEATTTTSTTLEATTTTTAAPDTTTSTAPAQKSATASVPQVMALQQRLADLGYDVGTPDGQWGARTTYSLMAFQKVEGLTRDGTDGPETEAALAKASKPGPMVPNGAPTRIEIDVARQVLFFWQNGSLARILPVSTGSGEHYCVDGACDTALTPGGTFRIGRKAVGLEVSPLGELWWPMYFNGGIAIHGSPSIPAYPASHGCIRIPMYAAPTFYDQISAGTVVHVLNSPEAVAPPDEGKAVPNAVAPPDTTTTTVAPAPPPEATTTTTVAPEVTTTTTTTPAVTATLPPTST